MELACKLQIDPARQKQLGTVLLQLPWSVLGQTVGTWYHRYSVSHCFDQGTPFSILPGPHLRQDMTG